MNKRQIHVRKLVSGEIVKTLDVTGKTDREVERIMSGMLRNMNTERYYIDDEEPAG